MYSINKLSDRYSACKSNEMIRLMLNHYLNNDSIKSKYDLQQKNQADVSTDTLSPVFFSMLSGPCCTKNSCYYDERLKIFQKVKEIIDTELEVENMVFFMHGSYAVGGITSFSDIDLGIIMSKSISLEDLYLLRKLVRKILRYIYSVDPLMHHGVDVILTQDLVNYDESILPVDTLRESVVLSGHSNFEIFVNHRLSLLSAKNRLYMQCESVILYEEKIINYSSYKLKGLISVVLLIAVLFTQVDTGRFFCKREAIDRFRRMYEGRFSFRAIDMATELRKMWSVPIYVNIIRNVISLINFALPVLQNAQRFSGMILFVNRKESIDFIRASKIFAISVKDEIDG